jgi:hypothetical protein
MPQINPSGSHPILSKLLISTRGEEKKKEEEKTENRQISPFMRRKKRKIKIYHWMDQKRSFLGTRQVQNLIFCLLFLQQHKEKACCTPLTESKHTHRETKSTSYSRER